MPVELSLHPESREISNAALRWWPSHMVQLVLFHPFKAAVFLCALMARLLPDPLKERAGTELSTRHPIFGQAPTLLPRLSSLFTVMMLP